MPSAIGQGLIWGLMAIGVYISFRILDLADLTVDSSFCTGAATCVIMIMNGYNMFVALICAFIVGLIAGAITGLIITKCGIPAILAGILTQLGLYSVNLHIMGIGTDVGAKSNLAVSVDNYDLLVSARYVRNLNLDNPIFRTLIICILAVVLLYWFFGTEFGCSIRSTGSNEQMSRAQGINTDITKIFGLALSNGFVALSGALFAQYQGFSDINMGRGAIVIGLAAVIIGEVLFSKVLRNFAGKLVSCILGAIIYYIVIQFVLKLGLSTDDLKLLTAIVVMIFLAVPYWKKNLASKKMKGAK